MFQKDLSGGRELDEIKVGKQKVGRTFKGQTKPKRLKGVKRIKLERRVRYI